MTLLALDPGSEKTAWISFDGGEPLEWAETPNAELRRILAHRWLPGVTLAVEYMRPRGMPTSQQEMDTMFEAGRLVEAWGGKWMPISRHEVKIAICGRASATDANIRAALIDHFGGPKAIAPARKCEDCKGRGKAGRGKARAACALCTGSGKGAPAGVLHGLTGDCWAALAVAVTAGRAEGREV